jgi:hypothetical protein
MAKKIKKGSEKFQEEKEFDLPEGLELLETNGWGNKVFKWIKDNFSAIILPIIALVILGGGIYLYSQQKSNDLNVDQSDLQSGITIDLEKNEGEEATPVEEVTEKTEEVAVAPITETKTDETVVKNEEVKINTEETVITPAPATTSSTSYSEVAQKGDGVTNLARRALKTYITSGNIKLSVEQKVYAEDYVQNNTDTRMLTSGEKIEFSNSLIKDAISQAQKLTVNQLHNLEQYSRLVPSLNY